MTRRWTLGSWMIVLGALGASAGVASAQVAGVVKDGQTNLPIPDARVSLQASNTEAQSDGTGAFDLPSVTGADQVIVAAKQGYYYGSATVATTPATGVEILLQPSPTTDNASYAFVAPESCSTCHSLQYDEWSSSPMSHAGLNTWVYDVYDGSATPGGLGGFVYTRDSVIAKDNPESECASCHEPEAWVKQPYSALLPMNPDTPEVKNGVSCEICHKIASIDETKPNFPGIWPGVVSFTRPGGAPFVQVMYGRLGDVTYEVTNTMKAAYNPQLGAGVCAACHQDKNDPDLDGDFEEPNGVISEPTFVEWRDSPYGDPADPKFADCVACHMKPSSATQACSMQFPPLQRPAGDVRSHVFEGTTAEYLENAVTMTLTATESGGVITADVTVDNDLTGHHVPTGVTIRNVILLVEAWREQDGLKLEHTGTQVIHDLGGVGDPAQGYYAGLPGKLFAKVNSDAQGKGPTFFTDAVGITFDTRIPATASDATQYSFAVPQGGGELHVRARLLYRRSWRALTDAKQWTQDGHGNVLEDVSPPYFGHLMEESETTIDLPYTPTCDGGPCPEGGAAAGGTDAGGAGGSGGTGGTGGSGGGSSGGSDDDGGCGCRAPGAQTAPVGATLLALGLAWLLGRRRRRN